MDITAANEKQLLADIDRLREEFTQTQDLYREVCILLFFRYGMTPTANKLYQLVRKGSMTAPAEALNKFWGDLREKSRVRIEHPDLPEALKTAAGDLTATLWSAAQAQAHETLASLRGEAQVIILEAKAALTAAETERDTVRQTLQKIQLDLDHANERIAALNQQLAAGGATNAAIELQLTQAKEENASHQQRLDDARRDFAAELDKLRAAAHLAEERFRAAETRALLEIDRERSAAAKSQKELDAVRNAAAQTSERHRAEVGALQEQLGDFRQKAGILEGNLQAVTSARDMAAAELRTTQKQLADMTSQISSLRTDAENWQRQVEEAQRSITTIRESQKPARPSRKPKAE
jgi:chromosome segregation ATPase